MRLTTEQLEQRIADAEKATPGPWIHAGMGDNYVTEDEDDCMIASTRNSGKSFSVRSFNAQHIANFNPEVGVALCREVLELRRVVAAIGPPLHEVLNAPSGWTLVIGPPRLPDYWRRDDGARAVMGWLGKWYWRGAQDEQPSEEYPTALEAMRACDEARDDG